MRAGPFRGRHMQQQQAQQRAMLGYRPASKATRPVYLPRIALPAFDAARRKRAFEKQTVPTKFRYTGGGVDFAQTSRWGWQSAGDRTCTIGRERDRFDSVTLGG